MDEEILLGAEGEEDEGYEPDILTLEDEEGREHTFEVLDAADVGDKRYLAMVPYHENPADSLEEDAEMLVMRIGGEGEDEYLDIVEDDEELFEVSQVFLKRLEEVYNIDLDELRREGEK